MNKIVGLRKTVLSRHLCVEKGTTDDEIIAWTEADEPCGTMCGWVIDERQGRVQCDDEKNREHVVVIS
jgi:hypothetical protein